MKSLRFLLLFMLLITFFVASASSEIIVETYSIGFTSGATNANPELCICGTLIDHVLIKNDAPYPQVFRLSSNLDFAMPSTSEVTIPPGEDTLISFILERDCSAKPQELEYLVFVQSVTGEEHVISRNLKIGYCQTIDAKLFANKSVIDICEPLNYTLFLTNPSTVFEDYLVKPVRDNSFFSPEFIERSIAPGQTSVFEFVYTPDCEVSGSKVSEFKISASRTEFSASVFHELLIEPSYDFNLIGHFDLGSCRYEIKSIPFDIENTGLVENTYKLNLKKSPSFVSLMEESINVSPGEKGTFHLLIEPGFKTKDLYSFILEARTTTGDFRVSQDLFLALHDCYATTLSIANPDSLRICERNESLIVHLKNEGSFVENYSLRTNTPKAVLSSDNVILGPGDGRDLILNLDLHGFSGKILFEVEAFHNRNLLKHAFDSVVIDVVPLEDCSRVRFPLRSTITKRYYDETFSVKVFNTGIDDSSFNVVYEGSPSLLLLNSSVFIKSGEFEELEFFIDSEEVGDHFFALTLIADNGEVYGEEFKLSLTKTPVFEKFSLYVEENPCVLLSIGLVLFILILVLSYIFIGPIMGKYFKLVLAIILVIGLVFLFFGYGLPKAINPALESSDVYELRLYQGSSLKLDLNDFVIDPDGDVLVFEVVDEPSNVFLSIENSLLKVRANDEVGFDRFRILADDQRGGVVTTPRFNVEVVEKTKLSCLEFFERFCGHINMALIIILLVLLIVLRTKSKKAKSSKRSYSNKSKPKLKSKPKKVVKNKKVSSKKTTKSAKKR